MFALSAEILAAFLARSIRLGVTSGVSHVIVEGVVKMEVTINNSNRVDSLWHSDDVANLVDDVVAMFVQNKTEQDVAFSGLAYVLNMMLAQVSAESGCRQARDLWENTKAVIDAQMMLCKGDA